MKTNKPRLSMNKKGQAVSNLLNVLFIAGITVVIAIVAMAIGAKVLQDIQDDNPIDVNDNHTFITNITDEGGLGLMNLANQTPLMGTVVALSVVLLILIVFLFRSISGGVR